MTVSPNSRYRDLAAYDAPAADGGSHPTLPARLLGPATAETPYLHTVVAGETMESLAHRYFGSSAAWWRIADANPAVLAFALPPGAQLVIPTGRDGGLVVRTRSF